MNVLRRLLLGAGRFPAGLRAELEAEGAEILEEGLAGSITWRDYRAPGKRFSLRKSAINGALALTRRRLVVVRTGAITEIDLPLDHPLAASLTANLDAPGRVCLAYDAGAFHADRSGRVEVRLATASAERLVARFGAPAG